MDTIWGCKWGRIGEDGYVGNKMPEDNKWHEEGRLFKERHCKRKVC